MSKLIICFAILLLSIVSSQRCTVTIEGNPYDLSPLIRESGQDDYSYAISNNEIYYFNICNDTVNNPCGTDSIAYKYEKDSQKCTSLGSGVEFWSLHHQDETPGLIVEYKGGDFTSRGKERNRVSFVFHCNPNAGAGSPKVVPVPEYSHTVIHWESSYGCLVHKPSHSRVKVHRQ